MDVAVVGGGPSGIATALTLVEHGCTVLVVERTRYEKRRVGETFPPAIQPALADLDLWERFEAAGHRASFGIRSVWGAREPFDRSFLFDPYGGGWHVDRRAFDEDLALAASARGVHVEVGCRLLSCEPGERLWTLSFGSDAGTFRVETRFAVDATGRASVLARKLGRRRTSLDRLVAVLGFFRRGHRTDDEEPPVLLLEAAEEGWWYSAPLPEDRLVVAYHTDADLCAGASTSQTPSWISKLEGSPHTRKRAGRYDLDGEVFLTAAHTSSLNGISGDGWLAVGDAAFSFDPLSGDGVHRALHTGKQAGEAVVAALSGDEAAPTRYARALDELFQRYREQLGFYYRKETRWRDSAFWIRRCRLRPLQHRGDAARRGGDRQTRSADSKVGA